MLAIFYKNPRLLIIAIGLIVVAGTVSFLSLPRMEDPILTPRAGTITTFLPGADAERVESLVTEKIEDSLQVIKEIKELRSTSRAGVSFIAIELRDEVNASLAATVWTRVRDKAENARLLMPADASDPEFEELDVKAYAYILALRWEMPGSPSYGILSRLLKQLKDQIDAVEGTEKSDIIGNPDEEILVTIRPDAASSMNLDAVDVSRQILASDSKVAAGQLRADRENVILEVSGELDNLTRIMRIPIQIGSNGNIVELADIANVERTIRTPASSQVRIEDQPSVALGVLVRPSIRLDQWVAQVEPLVEAYEAQLPPGIQLERIFSQSEYIDARMKTLFANLLIGVASIFFITLLLMGWRSAIIIGSSLPLGSCMVLASMQWLELPIHQISISGLIISLGLMIDNAIVIVDEVAHRLRKGNSREMAVGNSERYLFVPLLGSTVTTILSFGPIALMSGPSGEFVGSIAIVAIIGIFSSFLLAVGVISALAGLGLSLERKSGWIHHGISIGWLTSIYRWLLTFVLRRPIVGVFLGILFPVLGFLVAPQLEEQFFPPADRNQFHIEVELTAASSMSETEKVASEIRNVVLQHDEVESVVWFLGESAPVFYYNLIPERQNAPQYGQAIVTCREVVDMQSIIRELQVELESKFAGVTVLARQLEQGPPFSAPIEVRLFGPDTEKLQSLGEEVQLMLSQTPDVIQIRTELSAVRPKITFAVNEEQARLAGLDHLSIAQKMNTMLEGITGGSLLEETEELPVRVRVSGEKRADLNQIASMDLLASQPNPLDQPLTSYEGIPLSAISDMKLDLEISGINRLNGQRMNEVQAFITAGVLPSIVLQRFEDRLNASGFSLPPGYTLSYGGADAERNDAVGGLVNRAIVLLTMMVAAMVLSLGSFRLAGLLFVVAGLSFGLGLGSLWLFDYPWGFTAIVGGMGMIGVAVNDSIVVLAAIQQVSAQAIDRLDQIREQLIASTRHVLATTLTTVVGFAPLVLEGGDFWPPLAVVICGGVGGATLLALFFVPCSYLLLMRRYRHG